MKRGFDRFLDFPSAAILTLILLTPATPGSRTVSASMDTLRYS